MKNDRIPKVLIYCCALVPLHFAVGCIVTFGFTNYRAHLAYIGLPLGVAMLVLAIGMFFLKRVAIIISMALATLALCGATLIFFKTFHPFLALVILAGLTYLYYSKQYLWPTSINT